MAKPRRNAKETPGQTISGMTAGSLRVLQSIPHGGALEARRLKTGRVQFYWRHTEVGVTERVPIGLYDSSAPPKSLAPTPKGYSVAAAADEARELAKKNAETPGGLRAERERQKAKDEAQEKATAARQKYTLEALCDEYCDWLEKREKGAHKDARNIFDNHLKLTFPDLTATPAAHVEKRQIVEAVRKLTEAGKMATARKMRSYLRAAYACAVRADSDPALPAAFIAFGIAINPVESITPIKGNADKNPLPLAELRRYWLALKAEPGVIGAALRLQLLTGGQRIAQLARLNERDVAQNTMQLLDPKGKRTEPRPHLLPITKQIRTELDLLSKKGYLLSTDGGTTPMHPTSLTAWATEIAGRAKLEGFQLKRVRSGIETALAGVGIPLQIRGQLQSHGISGVQATHYDAHEYLAEKRHALDTLYKLLERKDAKTVAPIKGKKPRPTESGKPARAAQRQRRTTTGECEPVHIHNAQT